MSTASVDPEAARRREEEATSPFPLERGRGDGEVDARAARTSGQREKPPHGGEPGSESDDAILDDTESEVPPAVVPLTESARRARRGLVGALAAHSLAFLAIGSLLLVRWFKGFATPPELALAIVALGIGLVHLRASGQLSRFGKDARHDGAVLSSSLASLRSIFVLKAVVLFVVLALSCFSLSMAISLIALI